MLFEWSRRLPPGVVAAVGLGVAITGLAIAATIALAAVGPAAADLACGAGCATLVSWGVLSTA